MKKMRSLAVVSGIVAVAAFLYFWLTFYPDILWYTEVGYLKVYLTRYLWQMLVFVVGTVLAGAVLFINCAVARRMGIKERKKARPAQKGSIAYFVGVLKESMFGGRAAGQTEIDVTPVDERWISVLLTVFCGAMSVLFGWLALQQWGVLMRFFHMVPTQVSDPLFHKDISFYLFAYPVWSFVQRWSTVLAAITILMSGWIYFSDYVVQVVNGRLEMPVPARRHLLVLFSVFFLLIAWLFRLKIFALVGANHTVFTGASYADMHAVVPGLWCATVMSVCIALVALCSVFVSLPWTVLASAIVLLGASLVFFNVVYVPIMQKLIVAPNEMTKERPYIENNIKATREAFGLNMVKHHDFPYQPNPSQIVQQDVSFMRNLRVIDPLPLKQTLRQIQSIRTYYDFNDVDIDRYTIGGRSQQVLVAARELFSEKIPERGRNWINDHLKYTHGYGVVMTSVADSTPDGLPKLLVRDIPPTSTDIQVTRPQIYFGERTDPYIIVKTATEEFDYPEGDTNKYTSYAGTGGIAIGSVWRKLLYALHFGDLRILFSSYLTKSSRIFYHRQILSRVQRIMPLLGYDSDPYIVVNKRGELYWIIDAYVTMHSYPCSTQAPGGFNYLRNSVKVVVNAYTGETKFYVFEHEPVIDTYARMFPGAFRGKAEFPQDLLPHVRYPEGMFRVQSQMYQQYHMTDPQVFYNQEDLWAIPQKSQGDSREMMLPYYVMMKLPGSQAVQFVLMQPFSPNQKDNMVGWLAASCDQQDYGALLLYRLPKQTLVYGPLQIEARIDQDPDISKELSLWGQKGSRVYRGNLLVVPIQNTFLYVEPIYLVATEGQIPELKRVIVASGEALSMGATLTEALTGLLGSKRRTLSSIGQTPAMLAQDALRLYRAAKAALKKGAWSEFGAQFDSMEQPLQELSREK